MPVRMWENDADVAVAADRPAAVAAAVAVAVPDSSVARCLDCGYALRGLTSRRCPECGRPFDPADPWSVRLPHRPNAVARWLMRPPTKIARAFPLAAAVAAAWGTRVPGWSHVALHLGIVLLLASLIATLPWRAALRYVRDSGYDDPAARVPYLRWVRHLRAAALAIVLLVALRPTMYGCFWISRPWLDPVARDVLAQPFEHGPPLIDEPRGLYFIRATRRCPHGVKLSVDRETHFSDGGPGFVYLADPAAADCHRFRVGRPLGGGWYASD
jgi:hypothetical protein